MGRAFVFAIVLTALGPAALRAQVPDEPERRTFRLTAGLGVSYVGLGLLGEMKLRRAPISILVGAGAVPTYGILGASAGLRVYPISSASLYMEVMGALVPEAYGPAGLVGIARGGPSQSTYNVAVGVGRQVPGSWGFALDIGFGWTWGPV